jgi:Kdo2-lipid IVA lauroyltransferase/acyltransferase
MLRLLLLKLALGLARWVPFGACVAIGAVAGRLSGRISPARGVVRANLVAMQPGPNRARHRVSDVFSAYGRYWGEFLALAARPGRLDRLAVRVEGEDHLRAAAARGAVCIATGHLGNWDLGSRLAARRLPRLAVMAEQLAPPSLFRFFSRIREAGGCRVIPADRGGLRLYRHLRQGDHAAILADRVFGSGVRGVAFLGGEREFPAAGLDLALRAGASVVPAFLVRERGGYRLRFYPAVSGSEDPVAYFARCLETEVRMFAGQWCLLYPLNSRASGTEPARVRLVKGKAATR